MPVRLDWHNPTLTTAIRSRLDEIQTFCCKRGENIQVWIANVNDFVHEHASDKACMDRTAVDLDHVYEWVIRGHFIVSSWLENGQRKMNPALIISKSDRNNVAAPPSMLEPLDLEPWIPESVADAAYRDVAVPSTRTQLETQVVKITNEYRRHHGHRIGIEECEQWEQDIKHYIYGMSKEWIELRGWLARERLIVIAEQVRNRACLVSLRMTLPSQV
ncbi:hypothetical protein JCM10212_002901 [Sporobolomyces blumeae]